MLVVAWFPVFGGEAVDGGFGAVRKKKGEEGELEEGAAMVSPTQWRW